MKRAENFVEMIFFCYSISENLIIEILCKKKEKLCGWSRRERENYKKKKRKKLLIKMREKKKLKEK